MPSELSAEAVTMKRPAFDLGKGSRLAMIALGYLPLLHVAATIGFATLVALTTHRGAGVLTGIALLYLLPPSGGRAGETSVSGDDACRTALCDRIAGFHALVVYHAVAGRLQSSAAAGRIAPTGSRVVLDLAATVGGQDRRIRLLVAGRQAVRPLVSEDRRVWLSVQTPKYVRTSLLVTNAANPTGNKPSAGKRRFNKMGSQQSIPPRTLARAKRMEAPS